MSETVIEAFERLAREYLDSPELSVQHTREPSVPIGGTGSFEITERTEIQVTHYGEPDALEDLEDAHGEAIMSSFYVETRELTPGMDSDESVMVAEAEFVLGCDPYDEYVSGGAGGAVSASSSSGSATPSAETDGHEASEDAPERAWGDGLENPPTPAQEVTATADGTRHVLVAADEAEDDEHVCGLPPDDAEYEGSVKDLYDSLLLFAADPDLCEECARTVILFYNLPEERVLQTMEDEYDG